MSTESQRTLDDLQARVREMSAGAVLLATCERCRNHIGYLCTESDPARLARLASKRLQSLPLVHTGHTAGSDTDTARPRRIHSGKSEADRIKDIAAERHAHAHGECLALHFPCTAGNDVKPCTCDSYRVDSHIPPEYFPQPAPRSAAADQLATFKGDNGITRAPRPAIDCPRITCSDKLNPLTGRCPTCGATLPGFPA